MLINGRSIYGRFFRLFLISAILLSITCLALFLFGFRSTLSACLAENRGHGLIMSNIDVEIVQIDCSTLGEDSSVLVKFSRLGTTENSVLFKYDPANDNPLPTITQSDDSSILISVPVVSSIFIQKNEWEDFCIRYNIGTVRYPGVTIKTTE